MSALRRRHPVRVKGFPRPPLIALSRDVPSPLVLADAKNLKTEPALAEAKAGSSRMVQL
jgi:hypothetical protein